MQGVCAGVRTSVRQHWQHAMCRLWTELLERIVQKWNVPGAAQSKVPAADALVPDVRMILAKPTSAILATPPRPSNMLWLFRSKWMICTVRHAFYHAKHAISDHSETTLMQGQIVVRVLAMFQCLLGVPYGCASRQVPLQCQGQHDGPCPTTATCPCYLAGWF